MALNFPVGRLSSPNRRGGIGRRLSLRFRLIAVAVVSFIVLVVAVETVPELALNSASARRALTERLEAVTGQQVSIDGKITFSLLPRTRIYADRVRIGPASDFSIERVVADFDPTDALMGKASLSRVLMIRPEYHPTSTSSLLDEASSSGSRPRALAKFLLERFDGLQILEVRGALMRPSDDRTGVLGFSNGNFTVTQSSKNSAVHLNGSMIWNGQPTDVDVDVDAPRSLLSGGSSDVDVELSAPPMTASFDGDISFDRDEAIVGDVSISSQSLSRTVEWLTRPGVSVPEVGSFDVDGHLVLAGTEASLGDADVTIAGSQGRGAIEAKFGSAIPVVSGTLAFRDLDMTPFTRSVAPLPETPFDYKRPIDIGFADALKLDIRLSAANASLGHVPMADVAAALLIGNGQAKIDIGDASVFGGRGQGTLAFDAKTSTATGSLSASDIDTADLLKALRVRSIGMTGRSNLSIQMNTPVRDWSDIATGVQFDASVTARNGAISGFDAAVFQEPGARPLVAGSSDATVPFTRLKSHIVSKGPNVRLDELMLLNDSGTLEASGGFSALDDMVNVSGHFSNKAPQASGTSGGPPMTVGKASANPLSFRMVGRWPNPSVSTEVNETPG